MTLFPTTHRDEKDTMKEPCPGCQTRNPRDSKVERDSLCHKNEDRLDSVGPIYFLYLMNSE